MDTRPVPPLRIYVASSWRNARQPEVVRVLRAAGHEVYDFRENGFGWREIDPDGSGWYVEPPRFLEGLQHPTAERGFKRDMDALRSCDACVLVLPCGRSAHLELGWAVGAGKWTAVLFAAKLDEPELMYKMVDVLAANMAELLGALGAHATLLEIDRMGVPV